MIPVVGMCAWTIQVFCIICLKTLIVLCTLSDPLPTVVIYFNIAQGYAHHLRVYNITITMDMPGLFKRHIINKLSNL